MKINKAIDNRINEVLEMAANVDQFYCDWDSTIEDCLWNLSITYNDKFVWIKSEGMDGINERITLSKEDAREDLNYYLKHIRKGLKRAANNK